ncbi:MAG: tRNA pseudouridine(55) synthase TruB [Spirochaetaceae bacterium]|jgi:tRNA pseudouridine55 synthase|nr:tRNA pseudouridine(55) synthase TruB [Spirochaetaceae bacterium]
MRDRREPGFSGLVLLNKQPGVTSFQALDQVKKIFSTGKVGHTGTLDKFASGLLVVLVGRAVKLSPWFSSCDKYYSAGIRFGLETATLDPEGEITAEAPVPDRQAVEDALAKFRGDILQAPPVYSAVHINGVRSHKLARSGIPAEPEKRPVTIYDLELVSWEPPFARIMVHCSKGVYIRSLARDLALEAGSRAHLVTLERTGSALFTLEDAVDPENLNTGALKPISPGIFRALKLPVLEADDETAACLAQGKALAPLLDSLRFPGGAEFPASGIRENTAGVFDKNADCIAVLTWKNGRWAYGYVYARN